LNKKSGPEPTAEVGYETLISELNQLVGRIERDETGVDELTGAVNRAYDIVSALRSRIVRTEELLASVIAVREAETAREPSGSVAGQKKQGE
jgi:exonuclease VII small subunit